MLAKVNSDLNQGLAMQYQVRGIPAVKAFVNGQIVNEFVGAQPEPMIRQFVQGLPQPKGTAKEPVGVDAKPSLARAQQLLRQGKGCEAQAALQQMAVPQAEKLLPLARFLCQGGQGVSQQAVGFAQRGDYGAALYHLLVAANQEGNREARAVMGGIFALLGEQDPLTKAYQGI